MKGTVPRPNWPAPAVNSATHPKSRTHDQPLRDSSNRITLALLEEHSASRSRGYDPYNASAPPPRGDIWASKPKRR